MPTVPAPSRRRLGVPALLLLLLLSACGSTSGAASGVTSAPATPRASRSAPSLDTPATARPVVAPVPALPEAARRPDEAGAAAFAQHFGDLLLHAQDSGDTAPLAAVGTDDCTTCASVVHRLAEDYVPGNRREGGELHVRSTEPLPSAGGERRVAVLVTHDAELVLIPQGPRITARSTDAAEWKLQLLWTDGGWRVTAVNRAT